MNVQDAMSYGLRRQRDGRNRVRAFGRAELEIFDQLSRNIEPYVCLRFLCAAADVRREYDVWKFL